MEENSIENAFEEFLSSIRELSNGNAKRALLVSFSQGVLLGFAMADRDPSNCISVINNKSVRDEIAEILNKGIGPDAEVELEEVTYIFDQSTEVH